MLLPCSLQAHATGPALHAGTQKLMPHILRHARHRIHHAVRAAPRHVGSLVSAACHTVPGALAIAALGVVVPVPAPTAGRPPATYAPAVVQPPSPSGQTDGVPGWILSPLPGTAMASPTPEIPPGPGSALLALTPAEVPPSPTAVEILAPFIGTATHAGLDLPMIVTTGTGLPVPEPSSLWVLALALTGMALTKRTPATQAPA